MLSWLSKDGSIKHSTVQTKWISAFRCHQEIHGRQFKCDLCKKSYDDEETLKRHRETHSGGDFKCEECDKTFTSLFAHSRHQKNHHRMIQSEGGFMMLDIEQMANTAHDPGPHHKCHEPGCGYVADRKDRLNHYILTRHKSVSSPRKVYKCDGCSYLTSKASNFRVHLLTCRSCIPESSQSSRSSSSSK